MNNFKHIASWFIVPALLAVSAGAQTRIVLSYEAGDASQFSYKAGQQGLAASVSHRFNKRWEGIIAADISNAQKSYLDNGHHLSGSLAARFYLTDRLFIVGAAAISRDRNDTYTKTVARGSLGAGLKVGDCVGTLTAFGPTGGQLPDPNGVKGGTLTVEYFRRLVGPLGVYSAGQASLASFNATYDKGKGFTGAVYKARAGVTLTF